MFCFNTVCAGLSTGSCHTLFMPLYRPFAFVFLYHIFYRYVYFDNFFYYKHNKLFYVFSFIIIFLPLLCTNIWFSFVFVYFNFYRFARSSSERYLLLL